MLIKANELIHTQTDTIKSESEKLVTSQSTLRTQNAILFQKHDAMMSYLAGDITAAYQEMEEYVQTKMELLCNIVGESADNSTSFAVEAEKVDEEAASAVISIRK